MSLLKNAFTLAAFLLVLPSFVAAQQSSTSTQVVTFGVKASHSTSCIDGASRQQDFALLSGVSGHKTMFCEHSASLTARSLKVTIAGVSRKNSTSSETSVQITVTD